MVTSDENFLSHTATTIASVLQWNPGCRIHWIWSGVNETQLRAMRMFVRSKNGQLLDYEVKEDYCSWLAVDKHASFANYYRLMAEVLLPSSLDKILYLDSDLLVRKNLHRLFNEDLGGGEILCAVHNPIEEFEANKLSISPDQYFNSGVMLISLNKWREINLTSSILDYLKENNGKLRYWDQDALNAVVKGRWKRLSSNYNACHYHYESRYSHHNIISDLSDPHIIHFSGNGMKPWQRSCSKNPFKKEYRFYRSMTPWPRYKEQGAKAMYIRQLKNIVKLIPGVTKVYKMLRSSKKVGSLSKEAGGERDIINKYFGSNLSVIKGCFKGMVYIDNSHGSQLLPKLIGTYELPVQEILKSWSVSPRSDRVVNIGCAEGYYAVGVARLFKDAKVYAYDTSIEAGELCKKLAIANNLGEQIQIKQVCNHENLEKNCTEGAVIICDIGGAELELLDPNRVPSLLKCDIIVETHDFIHAGITDAMIDRFNVSHDITIIVDTAYLPRWSKLGLDDALPNASNEERLLMLNEKRPPNMKWLIMKSLKL